MTGKPISLTETDIMRLLYKVALATAAVTLLSAPGVASAAVPQPLLNVVALGDSYASGVGAENYEPGTVGQCYRSADSYSQDLVAALRAAHESVNYTDVACSGAAIADLSQNFQGEAPQLNALTPTTQIVTLTIGTNDVGYVDYGGLCIQGDCSGTPTQAILAEMPQLGSDLGGLLDTIKTRSPRAKIVVTGYGSQLTAGPNATGVSLDPICDPSVFSAEERVEGNQVASQLDQTLRGAVQQATQRGDDATYVSPYNDSGAIGPVFAGHSQCESGTPFYHGFDVLAPGQDGQVALLHLTAAGQAALAQLIRAQVPEFNPPAS
jgi:hypothetical protein